MLKFKSFVFLLVLIGLTACKSSPTADTEGDRPNACSSGYQ